MTWKISTRPTQGRDISNYTVLAEGGSLPGLITATGELRAVRSVNISPERQGLLKEIFVNEGEKVNKGQLLAQKAMLEAMNAGG